MGIIGDGMGENHGIKCSFGLCQLAMGKSVAVEPQGLEVSGHN